MLRGSRISPGARNGISRNFSCSSFSLRNTKHSVSFFPTASYFDHESHEQRLKDHEAAVPSKPTLETTPRLFKDMIKPQDVCDLLWMPTFEDYVVSSLAKGCSLKGDPQYKIVSKSTITDSKLMFSNMVISWLDSFKTQIPELSNLSGHDESLSYTTLNSKPSHDFTEDVFDSDESMQSYGNSLLESKQSLESIIQFLLSRETKVSDYVCIMTFLTQNIHSLNPVSVKEFTGYLIGHISHKGSAAEEYYKCFNDFLCQHLIPDYPDLLRDLNASTLDKLSLISTLSGNLSTAIVSLNAMIQQYKTAPSISTWIAFLDGYTTYAFEKSLSKAQILSEISQVKPIIFHHKLDEAFFKFLLSSIVENVHDLSHLIQLALASSPEILIDFDVEINAKLGQILGQSNEPQILKAVQAAQLKNTLKQAGSIGKH